MNKKLITLGLLIAGVASAASYTRFDDAIVRNTVTVGGTTAADSKSVLDLRSTTKGFLPPRMTTTQRDAISSPTTGLQVFNTTTGKLNVYGGTAWGEAGSGGGFFSVKTNLLSNDSWEADTTNWTASAGSYARVTAAANIVPPGVGAASWDPAASTNTLTSNATTITANDGLSGRNGVISCAVKTAATDLKMQAWDGTNVLTPNATTDVVPSSSAGFARYSLNFIFPASGTIALRFYAQSDSAIAYIDDCYLGLADGFNVSQMSQASLYGGIKYTSASNCRWTQTGTGSFYSYSADSDCSSRSASGNGSLPGTNLPAVTFGTLPPGEYFVVAQGSFEAALTSGALTCGWELWDGTNHIGFARTETRSTSQQGYVSTISGRVAYTTAQSNLSFEVRADNESGATGSCDITGNGGAGPQFEILVYRYPTSSEQAFRPDGAALSGTLKSAQTANCRWTTTSGSFAAFSADSDCPASTASGNLSAPGTKIPGAVAGTVLPGNYMVAVTSFFENDNSGDTCEFTISDGTNVSGNIFTNNTVRGQNTLYGFFSYSAAQSGVTFQVHGKRTSGSTSTCNIRNDSLGTINFEMALIPLSQSLPAPLLVGSVTSNSAGLERVERARITHTADSTCAIDAQSGAWLSSVSCSSTGIVGLVFASSSFSANPSCIITTEAGNVCAFWSVAPTVSGATAGTQTCSSTTASNQPFEVICMGSR